MGKILLTRTGYEKLLKELELICRVERPQILREILETAQDGGLDRNADYRAALNERHRLEGRIRELQEILAHAEVLVGSNLPPTKVSFNSRVRLINLHLNQEQHYQLVGALEADAARGQLSITSPLGRALLGRSPGECIFLQTPAGPRSYRILTIQTGES